MGAVNRPERRLPLKLAAWALVVAVALLVFPPFHIRRVPSDGGVASTERGAVDIPQAALRFWNTKLVTPAVLPTDARTLIEALNRDANAAAAQYGRRTGLGGPAFYFLAGVGRVAAIDHSGVWLDPGVPGPTRLVLPTGPIFGNALRDATGLLDLKDFSSLEFNELGAELNRLAETRAQPALRGDVKVGSTVTFLAAAQADDASGDALVLKLVPISLTVK
jgi:predicted lipoprotein